MIASQCKYLPLGKQLGLSLADFHKEDQLDSGLTITQDIPKGHKVALIPIKSGEMITKFGQSIGQATQDIQPGNWVHSHNLAFYPGQLINKMPLPAPPPVKNLQTEFMGYIRQSGQVGTRNYIGLIATVNCSATVCHLIAEKAQRQILPLYPNIDGIVPISHQSGCGMSQDTLSFDMLQRTLKGYRDHPNFGAVLVIGLGCEVNQISHYQESIHNRHFMTIQQNGGTAQTIDLALQKLTEMAQILEAESQRSPASTQHLCVGLQCGGSDGLSGITANPALGRAVDFLVQTGGTAILSETPEIFGAQHLLTSRSSPKVANDINNCIEWWQEHAQTYNVHLDNNPSPGNKAGGLTTILEKSLGAVSKAGTSPVNGFYHYAEPIKTSGLVFMDSPGYDPVSATGQIASGANLLAFTTGRGSCFGSLPTPCLKLASQTSLYEKMPEDMDINCGTLIEGQQSLDDLGTEIYNQFIAIASGQKTKSENAGYGFHEFIPWQIGATL